MAIYNRRKKASIKRKNKIVNIIGIAILLCCISIAMLIMNDVIILRNQLPIVRISIILIPYIGVIVFIILSQICTIYLHDYKKRLMEQREFLKFKLAIHYINSHDNNTAIDIYTSITKKTYIDIVFGYYLGHFVPDNNTKINNMNYGIDRINEYISNIEKTLFITNDNPKNTNSSHDI